MSIIEKSENGFFSRLRRGLIRFVKSPDFSLIPAFLLPLCLILILLRMAGLAEGNALLLLPGLGEDQMAFYEALRRALAGDGCLLYSFAAGLGDAFYGTYFSYLASPISYLIALCGGEHLAAACVAAAALKAGFAGLTFALYLRRAKNLSGSTSALAACLYAVSSFSLVSAFLPALGDSMILLPLVLLGLDRLIHKKQCLLFTVSFFLALATNPEAGLVVGLFTILVFLFTRAGEENGVYNPMGEKRHFLHSLLRFLLFGALAFLLAAFALLPALHHLALNGVGDLGEMDHENVMNFDVMLLLLKLLPSSYDTLASGGAPFVYCGTLTLLLLPLYFFRTKATARERIANFALLFVVFLLLLTRPTAWFLDGLELPETVNFRFAYLFVFLLCSLGAEALDNRDGQSPRTVFTLSAVLILAVILMQYLADSVKLANGDSLRPVEDIKGIWLAVFCILLYAFFLLALWQMPKWKTVITWGLTLAVSAELVLSGATVLEEANKEMPFLTAEDAALFGENISGGAEWLRENASSPLYRTELSEYPNSQAIYNGLGGYGFKTDGSLPYSMKFLGGGYLTSSPVFSAFYGVRYAISSARPAGNWSVVHVEEEYSVWENRYALPIAFAASKIPVSPGGDYADRVNSLLHQLTDTTEDFFLKVEEVTEDLGNRSFYVTAPETGEYYLELNNVKTRAGEDRIVCNSRTVFEGGTVSTVGNTLVRLGSFQKGDTITVRLELANSLPENTEALFTYVPASSYAIFDALAKGGMTVTHATDGRIEGTVSVAADQNCVFTTIPYTQSWKITVDGKSVPAKYGMSGLLTFDATPGEHEIVLEYAPAYITVGTVVSCVSVLILGGYVALTVLQKKKKLPACPFLAWLLPAEKSED